MTQVTKDCLVGVHFDCETSKGVKFSSRDNDQPIEFVVGEGNMLKGFEEAVYGMNEGDKKTVEISSDDAYGSWSEENLITAKRHEMPEGVDIQVGTPLMMRTNDGMDRQVHVKEVKEEEVVLDLNHPLAGHDLNFNIEIIFIKNKV
ncbi:MAG TPA: FKBP-type peptidyl-prolyl cis-trans isomerase [Bacteroidales bacterium]|jgi:peptidylprolyl isomerase|nr:FKBP-type peptidyl-prolyl cis-trans isomerase [Bacteroidales bacterium]MDD4234837.1 FKBP-type peptidyl-prolyl cis-trans isomerase [Bacteroidales bacterium]MDY0159895.1 FKBP-type peptidyl-prolyl cis-trans isomerase [Bacteroidales bacterium]HXK82314.1 FKBP-type peptidyl-prolyl cis-trans isomerase [Bacteroidales bacterium]